MRHSCFCGFLKQLIAITNMWNVIENIFHLKRPKKLSVRDRRYHAKDRICYKDKVIPLAEYNKRMNTHYTLRDVYDEAYVAALTEEDKALFDPYENMIIVPAHLESDKQFFECKLFAESWLKNDYSSLIDHLDEEIILVVQDKKTVKGKAAFVDYWIDLAIREKNAGILNKLSVVHSNYFGTAALFIFRKSYRPMYLFFSVKEGKITNAIYCALLPVPYPYELSKASCGYEWLPLDLEKITPGTPIQPKANYMLCMRCGKTSEQLLWNELEISSGSKLYKGIVTVCPDCRKVVDFRYETLENISSKGTFSVINISPSDDIEHRPLMMNKTYARSGWRFHQMVMMFMSPTMQKSTDVNSISKALEGTCFRLSPGYKLGLKIAEPGDYLGDNSFFYIYEGNRNCKDWNVFDHLLVEKSEVGAWQAYLMYTSPRIMPAYWHGLYENSKFIFIEDDLRDVPILKNRDFTFFEEDGLLYPTASFIDSDTAQVECTYWNDWKGLVRETVRISFSGDRVTKITTINTKALLDYHCGIYY